MDAALDAMRQLGFKKKHVQKTVQELLNVGLEKVLIFSLVCLLLYKVLIFHRFLGI